MNRGTLYDSDDDDDEEEDDDIGEDLEDLRRACIIPESNSDDVIPKSGYVEPDGGGGGEMPSDSENEEDDFEMLRSLKSQLAPSTDPPPLGLSSLPSDSESDDDFELLRSLKSQLALSMDARFPPMSPSDEDDEDDDSFETLRAIRRRFSAYANLDKDGAFMNDSLGKKKQVHASDNEPSSEILSRSNTCKSFPDQGENLVTLPDSEGTQQAGDSIDLHENSLKPTSQLSSFPEAAQAFVEAIRRNRAYQKFLRKKLTEIEAKIEQNEKHQKNVKIVVDFQASCKRITKQALSQGKDPRLQLISTPKCGPRDSSEDNDKKISPLTFGPPENPCVANCRMVLKTHPISVHRRSWSTEENENLAKGLKQQVQETLLIEAIERSSELEGSSDDIETINESIKNLEITPEMIRQFLPKVNWDQLASMYFKDRSAAECEARWMSSEDPLINHGPWTAEEENNLRLIIQEKGFTDWLDIAVSLGTNRTPFQCLARYQRSLNADILRKEWTPEEDDQLRSAVELYGEKDWQTVANALEGRAGTQCSNRWKKTLHPTRTRVGKFSSEEEKRLTVAVTLFGAQNWHKIARFVPGRTSTQCREKWANCLDPNVNHGKWTKEDDAKLREAMAEHEIGNWSKIASHVPRRTDNQCRRRWMQLYPHQVPLLQEATRLRKEAIVGNFVDRESQRPALLECKFLALPEVPLEPEPETVGLKKKKRKARPKKSDGECESEATSAAKERRPKRRKGLERCSGDACRQEDETFCENIENLDNEGEVFVKKVVKRDKFKTGQDEYVEKQILSKKTQDIPIGRIPVMVKSVLCNTTEKEKGKNGESYRKGECAFDQGGYFVIKGAEKVFIAQEQICTKRLWISNSPWTVSYRSETKRNRFIVRLSENQKAEDFKRREKVLTVYFLSTEIPVWVLFFALGVASDKEAVDLIAFDGGDASITNSVIASIQEADLVCEDFRHGRNALAYVENQIKSTKFPPGESVDDCLSLFLFPGLKSLKQKARFLGYMVRCLFSAYAGKRKCENRDNFRNKRIELAGELLERELRVHLAHARRTMTKAMQRHLTGDGDLKPIEHYLDASIITNGLSRAFSTGAWSHPFRKMERVSGVVANLGRANPLQTLIDLRRTRQQVLYTGRVGDARYPHPSHWGRVCFLSTPDGENCGLVKNLSLLGVVSTQIMEPVVEKLFDSGMEELVDDTSTPLCGKHKVLLNGDWVGVCSDSDYFVAELKSKRRHSELPRQMEIKQDKDDKEVRIFTDAGRLLRPLMVVENLHKLKQSKPSQYTFEHLLDQGILELIGIEEEEDCTTAWGTKQLLKEQKSYTHCELDLSFLLGVSCAIVPFANHDHGRRVLYQSQKHCQQAIGFSSTNPNIRCDTLSQQLFYPQKPLFKTMASECLQKDVLFNGQNAIVAVNVHLGFNQEDSIVMNKASLERGMFRSEQIRSYKADVDSKDSEKRKKMDEVVQFGKTHSKIGRVDSLDDDGFPFVGANMHSGDIVIGRCTESGTDHSVKLKHTERGIVQKVVLSSNDDGKNYAAVSLRQVRSPCLGDKFSSMHGQKGVLGYIEEQENFAFTTQGIVPDIVINPHAFPSRQTPGQLLEAALSKGIACPMQKKKGKSDAYSKVKRHATPFSTPSVDDITDQLHRAGFSRWGNERVYNGRTGEMMRSLIFMGPNFYQRLIHMSEDKVKFRNTGPVHPLTRQPVADRKRFGGIKFGEMERDCLIAHGASANLHERLFTLSDSSQMHICRNCKSAANVIERVASSGKRIRGPYCRLCESPDYVVMVNVPYGAKLLYQELFSMGISLSFETNLC